jgi:hypothetical protein
MVATDRQCDQWPLLPELLPRAPGAGAPGASVTGGSGRLPLAPPPLAAPPPLPDEPEHQTNMVHRSNATVLDVINRRIVHSFQKVVGQRWTGTDHFTVSRWESPANSTVTCSTGINCSCHNEKPRCCVNACNGAEGRKMQGRVILSSVSDAKFGHILLHGHPSGQRPTAAVLKVYLLI